MRFCVKLADCKPGDVFSEMDVPVPQTEAADIWRLFFQKIPFPNGAWLATVEINIRLQVAHDSTPFIPAIKTAEE